MANVRISDATLTAYSSSLQIPVARPGSTSPFKITLAALASAFAGVASFNTRTGAVTLTAADVAALNFSGLPTSDPGGGKLWLNGGVLQVGP